MKYVMQVHMPPTLANHVSALAEEWFIAGAGSYYQDCFVGVPVVGLMSARFEEAFLLFPY